MWMATSAWAVVEEESSAPAVRVGGVTLYPGLSIVEKSDNNIARTNVAKQSSMITVVSPSVVMQARKAADVYSLAYRADIARYSRSSGDNFNDQQLKGVAELAYSTRVTLRFTPEYIAGHDERGSTFGAPTLAPNKWHSTGVGASFTYGAEEARGRFVADLGYQDRQYDNNRAVTVDYDKTLRDAVGSFYFRVSPKIFAFVQAADTRISYKSAISTLSGNEQRYMIGATWSATAQTSGSFKMGQVNKKFDSSLRPAHKGNSWEGAIRWSPREIVRVDYVTSRKPSESTGVGNMVLLTNNLFNVAYDVTERTTLSLNTGKLTEDFTGAARRDDTKSNGLKAEHKLRSWLIGSVEYNVSSKKSTVPTADYDRNIFAISLRTEL